MSEEKNFKEIERKFLIANGGWKSLVQRISYIEQYYHNIMRIRFIADEVFMTFKKDTDISGIRTEVEFKIPWKEARTLITMFNFTSVSKTRAYIDFENKTWEIDIYHDKNDGLVVAEIELKSIDENIELPWWLGKEITNDSRFTNYSLSIQPFEKSWLTN
jgi:adenylate cyclase